MKWRVQGADRTTGRNIGVIVDAMNQEEASQAANAKGMLVASVEPADLDIPLAPAEAPAEQRAPVTAASSLRTPGGSGVGIAAVGTRSAMAAAGPAPRAGTASELGGTAYGGTAHGTNEGVATANPRRVTIPNYDEIISSAGWLNGLAACIAAIGWVALLWFLILVGRTLATQAMSSPTDDAIQRSLVWITTALITGLVFLALATIMRMFAAAGLAVRDMSRNTFRRDQQQ